MKRKPDLLLFIALLLLYAALGLAWHWYSHGSIGYADVRDELSLDVVSAGLTWIIAWYRWHKADAGG